MTPVDGRKPGSLAGIQTLTSSLLLVGAVSGLILIKSQVAVFGFGDTAVDARFFPRIVLGLLVLTVVIRLFLNRRQPDRPIGPTLGWFRVGVAAAAVAIGLVLIPSTGFLVGAALSGFATALAFGERRLIFSVGLPLALAAIVVFGARAGLNIPLP